MSEDCCWTIDQVADHLGITVDAARKQLSRWGIKGLRHYPAGAVIARNAERPGQGARTDRATSSSPSGVTSHQLPQGGDMNTTTSGKQLGTRNLKDCKELGDQAVTWIWDAA